MESYRANKFLFVTSVLSILILAIGGTFSFFSVSNKSKYDAIKVSADKIELALSVSPIYTEHKLIPTNDKDVLDMTAYKNECIDDKGYGACLAYEIEVSNFYKEQDLIGTIDFEVEDIENLSYIILDENEKVYLEKKSVTNGKTESMPLGENFVLGDATETNPTTKKFILIIWLTNIEDQDQNDADAGGKFSASVTFESVIYGGKLTGTINGYEDEKNSNVGGDLT